MIRVYVEDDLAEAFKSARLIRLSKDELQYLRVQRQKPGETIEVFNFQGQWARGVLEAEGFRIEQQGLSPYRVYPLTLAMALPELSALESVVRSATELGVERLLLFDGDRCQAYASRIKKVLSRAERIAKESMRQSGRPRPLVIASAEKIDTLNFDGPVAFMDEAPADEGLEGSRVRRVDSSQLTSVVTGNVATILSNKVEAVLVGPEGGWSPRERAIAQERRWYFCHYPVPILRVVTAVPVALFDALRQHWK